MTTEHGTFDAVLTAAAALAPDQEAVVDAERRLTYRQLDLEVDRYAAALVAAGVTQGDRVALWHTNSCEWVLACLAIVRVGAILVPINTGFTDDEAVALLERSRSSLLLAGGVVRGHSLAVRSGALALERRIEVRTVVGLDLETPGCQHLSDFVAGADTVVAAELRRRVAAVQPHDPAVLLYTSGTTGTPKGVLLPQRLVRNMRDAGRRMELEHTDVTVLYLPLFHVFALAAVATFLTARATVVLMATYSAAASLDLIERERASLMYGVPAHYYDQLRDPDFSARDLAAVRLCVAPGPGELIREVDRRIATAINCYGMTETTSMATLGDPTADLDSRSGTIGPALPLSQVRLVDTEGNDVVVGEIGEIVVRGEAVMLGYDANQEATDRAIRQGWFHTGDGGLLTAPGQIRFVGRLDEMFKVGGENVDPMEVEDVLMRHPDVLTAAVLGVPDPRLGQVGLAWLTLRPGADLDVDNLRQFARNHLASFKVPRRYLQVDAMPTTASGKVQKSILRAGLDS